MHLRTGRLAALTPSELSHLFKDNIGIPAKRLQAIFRIGYTLSDLIKTEQQVKHMAAESGFPVIETFIRNFEKVCGMPPNEFRQLIEELDDFDSAPPGNLLATVRSAGGFS